MGLVTTARAQRNTTLAGLSATVLSDLIDEASAAIERWCGRTFASATYTEKQPGFGTDYLDLDQWPVTAVTSVVVAYEDGTTDTITDLVIDPLAGRIRIDHSADPAPDLTIFPKRFTRNVAYVNGTTDLVANCTVTYTAGYSTIPYDVQRATIITMLALAGMDSRDPTMQSESLGDYSYTLASGNAAMGIPGAARALLTSYRRYAMA